MTLEELRQHLKDGTFHHATYRNVGKVWEGLYVYVRDAQALRGFTLAGSFNNYYRAYPNGNPECFEAEQLLREMNRGVSVGSFGNG
jgi:hypothetical protein